METWYFEGGQAAAQEGEDFACIEYDGEYGLFGCVSE